MMWHSCTERIKILKAVTAASEDGSSAVEHAHQLNLRKYGERCEGEGMSFLPLAVDTLGGWHPEALDVIIKLGRQLARNVGRLDEEVVRHLRQSLVWGFCWCGTMWQCCVLGPQHFLQQQWMEKMISDFNMKLSDCDNACQHYNVAAFL